MISKRMVKSGLPTEEIDIIESLVTESTIEKPPDERLTPELDNLNKAKFKHGQEMDRWAVRILIGCIVTLILIYVFERLIGQFWYDPNADISDGNLLTIVTETLKFLISSLIGFLFAKRIF